MINSLFNQSLSIVYKALLLLYFICCSINSYAQTPPTPSAWKSVNNGVWTLDWSTPSGTITSYRLYNWVSESYTFVSAGTNSYTVTSSVWLSVAACNGSNCSSSSPIVKFEIPVSSSSVSSSSSTPPVSSSIPPASSSSAAPLPIPSTPTPAIQVLDNTLNANKFLINWANVSANNYVLEYSTANTPESLGVAWTPFRTVYTNSISINRNEVFDNYFYVWRVKACNANNQCSGFAKTRNATFHQPITPSSTVLNTPASGSTVNVLPCFNWQPDPAATGFSITVSHITDFTDMRWVVDVGAAESSTCFNSTWYKSGANKDEMLAANLVVGQTYYWRVVSLLPGGKYGFTETRSFTVSNYPGAPTLDAKVINNTYWQLEWNKPDSSVTRYELTETANGQTKVLSIFNNTYIPIVTGSATYKIVACNSNGCGTTPSNTRTINIEPAPPTSSITVSTNVYEQNFLLGIGNSAGAVSYELEYNGAATEVGFSSSGWTHLSKDSVLNKTVTMASVQSHVYVMWRVRSCNTANICSAWQESLIKSNQYGSHGSGASLVLPGNSVVVEQSVNAPCFEWQADPAAREYAVTISDSTEFPDKRWMITVSGTSACWGAGWDKVGIYKNTLPDQLSPSKTYYWRVASILNNGGYGFSAIRSFSLSPVPGIPTLTAKIADDKKSWLLQWTRPAGNVHHYVLEEDNTNEAGSRWLEQYAPLATDLSFVSTLKGETKYKISACNAQNQCSLPSSVVITRLETEPAAPAQLLVAQDIELQAFNLEWPLVHGATKYNIQYLTADTPDEAKASSAWIALDETSSANYLFSGAVAYKYFKWRVSACKQSGICSTWVESQIKLLQQKPTLTSPVLLSPANGTQTYFNNINYPCFRWALTTEDQIRAVTKYVVTISTVPDFVDRRWYVEVPASSVQAVCWANGTGWAKNGIYPELLPAQLQVGATYYWRVVAVNAASELGFSETRSFTLSNNSSTTPSDSSISSQIYEAENASRFSGVSKSTDYNGYSGTGFGDFSTGIGRYIEWTIPSASAAQAILSVRYANGTADLRPMDISVNGVTLASNNMEYTGGWDKWKLIHFAVPLNAGNNVIKITSTSVVSSGAGNIDYIQISKGAVLPPDQLGVPDLSIASTSDGAGLRLDWAVPLGDVSYYQVQVSEPFDGVHSVSSSSFVIPVVHSASYQVRACKADNVCGVYSSPIFISNSAHGAEVAAQKVKARIVNSIPGYKGTGYAEFENTGYLEWNIYRSYAESGVLIVTYNNTSGTVNNLAITNNGNSVGVLSLPPTNSGAWNKISIPISLTAGNNFVRVLPSAPVSNLYIDQINAQTRTYNSPGITPPDTSASNVIFNVPASDSDGDFAISWSGARTYGELYEKKYDVQSQPIAGLKGKYYGYQQSLNGDINLANLTQVVSIISAQQPDAEFVATTVNYKNAGGSALGYGKNLQNFLGADQYSLDKDPATTTDAIIVLSGKINLDAGSYRFRVKADDGHQIKINGVVVSEYNGNTGAILREGSLFNIANGGNQDIEVIYWDSGNTYELGIELQNQSVTNYAYVGGSMLSHYIAAPPTEMLLKRGEGAGNYSHLVSGKQAGTYSYVLKDCYLPSASAAPECNLFERSVVVSASAGATSSSNYSSGSSSSAANLFNFDAEAPDEFKSLSGASNLPGLGQGQFVAATQGNLNVSNGAANYSINIDLPPAVRNLKPRLALTYNSQSGNKLMGVGWGLTGLSAITRCSPSFATEESEAQKSNPVYSKGDRLCLDGQKLVVATSAAPASNDAYWTTETEYKTELDNFSKIIAHGTSANGGHEYFKVTTKDGRVLTYGAEDGGQNSKIYAPGQSGGPISVWALDKVEDIYGNSYTVSYERNTANGEYYPAQINLGATGVVIFDYQDRIGQIPWGYNGGNKYQQTKVLSKVTTYLGASQSVPIKQYDIRYKVSPTTDRELVDKIYECGYGITGWQCANPVIFDWQIGELGFDTESSRLLNVGGEISAFEDINHDGYVDALGEKGILAWGEPSGGFTVVNYDEVKSFLLINTLAGRAAITTKERESGDQTYVDVFLSRFSKASTSLSFSLIASYKKTAGDVPVILVNDSNNDGLTDLIVQPVTTYSSEVWLQNSAGVFEKNPQSGEYIGKGREVSYVDYNGDRLKDLTYIGTFESGTTDPQNYLRGFENHGGFFTQSLVHKVSPTPPGVQLPGAPDYRYGQAPGYWHNWVDINADGNLDLLYQEYERDPDYSYIRYKPNYWTVRLSTGNSAAFTSMPLINTAIPVIRLEHAYSQYTFMYDYNKDGISEFILFSGSGAEGGSSSPSWFMRAFSPSYKQGVLSFVNLDLDPLQSKLNYLAGELTAPRAIAVNPLRGDVNNDGLMDLVVLTNINNYSYLVHHAKQQQPDLLSKITNGFGAITELSYSPLTNALNNGAPLYAPDAVAPVFPLGPVNRDMQVVKKISVSNGQGGFNNTYFNYVGGVQDLFRGFGGFKSITTTNTSTNVVSTTEYRQDWPYSGKIRKLIIRDNSGKLISVTENAYALHSENKRFPYLDFSIQKNYALTTTSENSPTAVSKVINTFDYCGNLKEQRSKTGTGITGYDITGEQSSQYVVNAYDYYGTVDCSDDFLLSVTQELAKSGGGDLKRIVTEFKPNARRDVWSRTDFKGESIQKTTIYDYQTNGVVKSVTDNAKDIDGTDELDRVTTYSNFLSELYPQTITNAENHATSITYDERFGAVKTESFLGQTTTNIYDSFGRLQSQTSPDKTVTENVAFYCNSFSPVVCPTEAHYAVAARVTNERQSHMLGEPLSIVFYDALQREVRSVIYSIGGKVINKVTQYNSNGYLHRVSEPYVTNGVLADSNGAMAWTTYSDYDALGRANNIVGPDGGAKTISYAVDGYGLKFSESIQVIKPTGASEIQTSNSWLNSLGQVTRTEDALYNTVTYTYDATGNLETALVNNNIDTQINIHHDLAGNKIYIKDPDAGVIDFNFNGFGELRKQVWQKGIVGVEKYITYDYDKLGRQISRIDTPAIGNSIPYTWVWDTRQQGQLTSRSGNGFHEEYFYDGFFRLSRQIVTTNGLSNGEFVYTYDDFSRPETVKYPGGFKIQRDYHAAGYQVQTQDVTSAITPKVLWALGSSIDSRGAFNNQLWGNGVVTQTGFDVNSGRLASIKSGRLSTTNNLNSLKGDVQNLNYTFDTLGNLYSRTTARTDSNGITLENIAENYGYDKLNRVKTITSSGLFGRTQTFDYDTGGLGNLVSRSDVLTGSSINNDVGELKYERVRKAGIHAVTSAGGALYSYDDYGNMIIRGGESILYDTFNKPTRLVGASITDFYYGPDHELYKEVSDTKTTYKLAGGMYEVIVDGNTTTQKSYVDGVILNNRVITSGTESANDTVYLHSDHLGSVEATTNALGQFVNRMSFGAWGERQKSDWKPGNPTENFLTSNGFTGHDQLDSHNLIHMGGRVYDPNLGRFLSADLYVQSPYDSQSYNRYSYTFNNPLSYTDPSGYMTDTFSLLLQQVHYQSAAWSWSTTVSYLNSTQWEGWRVVNSDGSKGGYMSWTDTSTANSVSAGSIFQTTSYNVPSWGAGPFRVNNFEPGIRQQCGGDAQCMQGMRIDEAQLQLGIMSLAVGGEIGIVVKAMWEARTAKALADSLKAAKGLTGKAFENYLVKILGGKGSFKAGGREFDGAVGKRWYEAKSGRYWDDHAKPGKGFDKFKSDIGARQTIAKQNDASYEIHSNAPIPSHVKDWLGKKGIPFTEH